MVKTLHCLTLVLLAALLVPLPVYARKRGGFSNDGFGNDGFGNDGFGNDGFRRGGFNTSQGSSRGSLLPLFGHASPAPPLQLTPAAASHSILRITLKTQDAEIYIDGRFVGLASDFNGTVLVSVPAGKHVVEFQYQGSSLRAAHLDIAPGSVTAIAR